MGMPIVFGELESGGHIDFFYCHPDWQGRGAGTKVLQRISGEALRLGIRTLRAEVSGTAEPFFTENGFRVVEMRAPVICNAPAKQFIMCKAIE